MPEANSGTFAIMDSPSVTPEPLGNTQGSFYNLQNLRSTYLLSALHSNSCSLTVHSININLKPLFLYKIPKHCVDILISSNILYGVQYVDLNSNCDGASLTAASSLDEPLVTNTEKESLDADTEKLEQMEPGNITTSKSDDTSATTTSASSLDQSEMPTNAINAVSVISSAMASLHTTDNDVCYFQLSGILSLLSYLYCSASINRHNLHCFALNMKLCFISTKWRNFEIATTNPKL